MPRIALRGLDLAPEWPPNACSERSNILRISRIHPRRVGSIQHREGPGPHASHAAPGQTSSATAGNVRRAAQSGSPSPTLETTGPGPEHRRGHANPAPVVADPAPTVRRPRPASYAALRAPAWNGQRGPATEHPVRTRVPRPWRGDHGSVRIWHYARSALYREGIPPGPADLHQTAHMRGAAAFSNEISNLPLEC